MKGIQNMEITWKHSFQQVEEILGVTDQPWIVNPFWEMDVSAQLDGKQLGELPMEKWVMEPPPKAGLKEPLPSGKMSPDTSFS